MKARSSLLAIWGLIWSAGAVQGEDLMPASSLPAPPAGKTWKLIWNDEFGGTTLDEAKWETPPDGPRHAGWWMRQAVSLDGQGHLVIQTSREGDKLIDGCVRTKGKFAHAFGYFEARVFLPREQGHWSAFWLFEGVHTTPDGGWYNGSEIDIYEKFWPNDEIKHTLYWDPAGDHKLREWSQTVTVPGIREGWHSFALWWKADEYIYYIDGKESWRINPGGICQVPLYIKLSDETDTWCKDISKANLPDRFQVDYVRVYDLAERSVK
jgi:beta-glucanase (GH16 family)